MYPTTCITIIKALNEEMKNTRNLMNDTMFKQIEAYPGQHREIKSNIILALRHIEDAITRLENVFSYRAG